MKTLKLSLIATAISVATLSSHAAVYQVVDTGENPEWRNSFATGINNAGTMVGAATDKYTFPIDFDNLNVDNLVIGMASARDNNPDEWGDLNVSDVQNGIIDPLARRYIEEYFKSLATDARTQKVGDQYAVRVAADVMTEMPVFDIDFQDIDGKTRSTTDTAWAINNIGDILLTGSLPYYKVEFTPEPTDDEPEPTARTYWQRDAITKAAVQIGNQLTTIEPAEATWGGATAAFDISDSRWVVGYSSTEIGERAQELIDTSCVGNENKIRPDQVCVWEVNNGTQVYHLRAYRWKLDSDGNVVESKNIGMLYEPEDTDERAYTSVATGVNEAGIVVGYTPVKREDDDTFASTFPFVYKDDQVIDFVDHTEYFGGFAYDINDSNIVVGDATRLVNGVLRRKFYYYNADTNEIVFPSDFFLGSSSNGRAINNVGQIVGEGEVESQQSARRRNAFLYDISTNVFENLNDLTTCDSPYTIVEARDINDDGVIAATALVTVQKKDVEGNLMVDDAGAPEMEEVPRLIKLQPIAGGTKDNCDDTIDKPSRKGAAFPLIFGSLLIGFAALRRKFI